MNKFLRFLPTGSIILAITTLASYGAGLFRDRIFAQSFGATRSLDAYNAAFLLPDLLFNIFIASGIAAAALATGGKCPIIFFSQNLLNISCRQRAVFLLQ